MTERPVSQIFQDILETIAYLEGFTNEVSCNLIPITHNTREFMPVEGLQLENRIPRSKRSCKIRSTYTSITE
jgi:hypothetical protein